MMPLNLTNSRTQYALSSFCKTHVFHYNFSTIPHEYDIDFSVKDHVLMAKKFCVILGSKTLVQYCFHLGLFQ